MVRSVKESALPVMSRVVFLVILVAGCSGDDPGEPGGGVPTFETIWPVGVGRYWDYALTEARHAGGAATYASLEDVPDLPDLEELYADLQADPPGAPLESSSASLRCLVTADLTADPDTTVMVFDYAVVNHEGYASMPLGLSMGPQWRRSRDRIAIYSGGYLQWVHLDGVLTRGHEFTVQLVPALADDIFLHVRVWRSRSFGVMGTTQAGCLECFYLIDMGIVQAVNENGEGGGFFRAYRYGIVIYAPEVGPVYCREKCLVGPDNMIRDDLGALVVREAVLQGAGLAE